MTRPDRTEYRILDTVLGVTGPETFLSDIDRVYSRFGEACGCINCSRIAWRGASISIEPLGKAGIRVETSWGNSLLPEVQVLEFVFSVVQNRLIREVRHFFAIHGASLCIGGKGCIITAPSATGKTTLCLELLRRGAGFLSDEIAALDNRAPAQHAFPRALSVRPGAPGCPHPVDAATLREIVLGGERKLVADAEALFPGSARSSTVPHAVFFLTPPAEPPPDEEAGLDCLEISLNALPEGFSERLASLPHVVCVRQLEGRHYPTLRISHVRGALIVADVDSIAAAAGALICAQQRGRTAAPDYSRSPAVRPLKPSEGIRRLLPSILNFKGLAELTTPAVAVFQLTQTARDLRFFDLTPGPAAEMAALVEKCCAGEGPERPD